MKVIFEHKEMETVVIKLRKNEIYDEFVDRVYKELCDYLGVGDMCASCNASKFLQELGILLKNHRWIRKVGD